MDNIPPIVSIVGKSKSGKTTLIEKLLVEFRQRSYRVATIKHHYHTEESMDTPGKDTWRHARAGAERVVLISPLTTVSFDYHTEPPSLSEIAAQMRGFDLILTEGFSQAGLPAIEVSRRDRQTALVGNPDHLIAIAADYPVPDFYPVFDLNDIDGIADLIEQKLMDRL